VLKENKIKVPYPVSVIGMGNIEASGYTVPMLTTVGLPLLEMGAVSVQVLISRIRKKHSLPLKITLPHKLILRDSVSNLHGGICI
jgi:DNA-binding LacI/PurR family transcriptional regulator